MLLIDKSGKSLSSLERKSMREAGYWERRDIQQMICRSPNAFFGELGESIYLVGSEVEPSEFVQDRIDLLGVDETGAGTDIAKGKDEREFDGQKYIMERGIVADLSLVHAWKGDSEGNLIYRKTARNFNPMVATAGKVTVAEVENLVEPGQLNPDAIITSGVFVQRMIHVPNAKKHIEQRTVRKRA